MASAAVHPGNSHTPLFSPPSYTPTTTSSATEAPVTRKHDVPTTLNYYKDPGDGSEPQPSYVGKPETYNRPVEELDVTVHDIRGEEEKYSLDGNGFRIWRHESGEKDFVDDEKIRAEYYKETEQLLKDA
jgi:hypothetical protein